VGLLDVNLRTDLIGTHLPINERRGVVADTRWME
jgi:hypothetical protein